MFGFSFSELVVVIFVALIVMGPKDLPKMLRRVGQYAGKLRRMAADLRAQSGIDDALRSEGLADDIAEIRKLARGELDAVRTAAHIDARAITGVPPTSSSSSLSDPYSRGDDFYVLRDREYPRDGADAYNALPENAIVYSEGLPKSALYRDPLYRMGDASAEIPAEPEPEPEPDKPATDKPLETMMGIGAVDVGAKTSDLEASSEPLPHEEATERDTGVGPTLVGVGSPLTTETTDSKKDDSQPQHDGAT